MPTSFCLSHLHSEILVPTPPILTSTPNRDCGHCGYFFSCLPDLLNPIEIEPMRGWVGELLGCSLSKGAQWEVGIENKAKSLSLGPTPEGVSRSEERFYSNPNTLSRYRAFGMEDATEQVKQLVGTCGSFVGCWMARHRKAVYPLYLFL